MSTASAAVTEELKKLTPKQELFCLEYIVDLNATQAAIRAGYSKKTAKEMGYENLTKPHISTRIAGLADIRAKRAEKSADDVIKELESVGFYRIGDIVEWNESGTPSRTGASSPVRRGPMSSPSDFSGASAPHLRKYSPVSAKRR